MANTSLHVYPHMKGIWKEIDNNNLTNLATHPMLQVHLNEKFEGVTPLFLACQRKNPQIIHFLLQYGADPNIECKGVTPLYLCCLHGEEESVQHLLNFGAKPSTLCTTRKISPLHLATSKGILSLAQTLVNQGANVDDCSPTYGTCLHVAARKNHKFMAKFLISNGASINTVTAEEGETALHIACRLGHVDIVRLLLDQQSINASIKDSNDGNTCLHAACISNKEAIALILISRFPDLIYVRNNTDRQTPLFYGSDGVRRAIKNAFANHMPGFPGGVNCKAFSDIRIHVQDKTHYSHKVVLYARCPAVLPSLSTKEIVIKDLDAPACIVFLHYLYTDSLLKCDNALLKEVIKYAERYKLLRLKRLCMDAATTQFVEIPESTFRSDFEKVINNPEVSDVTLSAQGNTIHCAKIILSQHEYFRAMFSGPAKLKESSSSEIAINDIAPETFEALIYYMYTWSVKELPADVILDLFQSASLFLVDGLRHSCEAYLCGCISPDNVCSLFQLADVHKSLFLKEECFDHIITHLVDLSDTSDYQSLPSDLKDEVNDYLTKKQQHKSQEQKPKKIISTSLYDWQSN